MLLYTAQPLADDPGRRTLADEMGLPDALGFRPVFCTEVDGESLGESWFRIWSAAPSRPERILLVRTAGAEPVPLDALAWTNAVARRRAGAGRRADVAALLRDGGPVTDWLLPAGLDGCEVLEVPVGAPADAPWPDAGGRLAAAALSMHGACLDAIREGRSLLGGESDHSASCQNLYAAYACSSMVPALWSALAGRDVDDAALRITPTLLADSSHAFHRAQRLLLQWDRAMAEGRETGVPLLRHMRRDFLRALSLAWAAARGDGGARLPWRVPPSIDGAMG